MKTRFWLIPLFVVLFSLTLLGPALVTLTKPAVTTALTTMPAASLTPAQTPAPTPYTPEPGWLLLRDGLEQRDIDVMAGARVADHLYLLRIDPAFYTFEVVYDAQRPKTLAAWQKQTGALLVFNGGFFRIANDRYLPAGLLAIDGQTLGESYSGYGGMFDVAPGGPELRWLVDRPYQPGEPLQYALQSFPMLVKPGGLLGFPASMEDNMLAKRTVLARDRRGRFVVMVTASSYFSLHRLSVFLTDSDLNLDLALNLDGGPSTGLLLAEPYTSRPAASLLPIVVAVYPR